MTDINEKETIQYFVSGIEKARSAAKELAILNQRGSWSKIIVGLDQILASAKKLYTGKPQSRMNNLVMAAELEAETVPDALPPLVIH